MSVHDMSIKRFSNVGFDVVAAMDFYRTFGFIVIEDFLTKDVVSEINNIIASLHDQEVEINKSYKYTENVDRVWNLVNKHILFSDLITNALVSTLMDAIFDRDTRHQKFFLSSFQATMVRPGAIAQALHIDTPVPNPLPPWEIKANTIWLLDDFTDKNGATEVVPGSHKYGRRPIDTNRSDHVDLHKITAPEGSLIVTSGYLWHRAGANESQVVRKALLGSFASSAFREISSEEDIIRKSFDNTNFKMSEACWKLVGGLHGIKSGI
jgi:ectoine hydroxylase-related dioxygenase (phytanoyl-CoA dioxygenase family)